MGKDSLASTLQQFKKINDVSQSKTVEELNDQSTQEAPVTPAPTLQEPNAMDKVPQSKAQELNDQTTHETTYTPVSTLEEPKEMNRNKNI